MSLESNILGNLSNSLQGSVSSTLKSTVSNLLNTSPGVSAVFDPVWKLALYAVQDPNTGNIGSSAQTVAGDPAGSNPPKYKFNWTVAINYRNTLNSIFSSPSDPRKGSAFMDQMYFGVKTCSRPTPVVNYQDANFYNYRTKIATRVEYGTVTISFYDDKESTAHSIYTNYLQSISPIANINSTVFADQFDTLGTSVNGLVTEPDPSSLGPLSTSAGEQLGLINSIVLVHYLPITSTDLATATAPSTSSNSSVTSNNPTQIQIQTMQYIYMNPKIVEFSLDELDMSSNESSTVSLVFNYDSVYIGQVPVTMTTTNPTTGSNGTGGLSGIISTVKKDISNVVSTAESAIGSVLPSPVSGIVNSVANTGVANAGATINNSIKSIL